MKAFLLAAGRGERLRPLTDFVPKCLLRIDGQPLLQIWLEHLLRSGIDEVLINTHWLATMIEDFVGTWVAGNSGLKIRLFYEPILLGSAGTLLANREWAGHEPFFIIYGDNLPRLDLSQMMACHKKSRQPLTIRVYRGADPERAGIVCLDEKDIVIDFEEKPAVPKSDLGAGGIYVADYRMFDFFPSLPPGETRQVLDLSRHVLPRMTGRMKAYVNGGSALDLGTRNSYLAARKTGSSIRRLRRSQEVPSGRFPGKSDTGPAR